MRYHYDDDDFLLDKNTPAAKTARSSQINIKNSFLKKMIKKLLMDGVSADGSHDAMSTQNPWYASIPMILRTHIITLPWRASPSTKREKGSFFAKNGFD